MRFRTLAAALLAWVSLPAAAEDAWSGVARVVAVGDVHGDHERFVEVLRAAVLIDEKGRWIGGKAHLVQTGDVPDRGPDTRKTLDLLRELEKQARRAGGYVHALIGNHEAMNVYGDLRYVSPEEYESFRDARSAERRERYYEHHLEGLRANAPASGRPTIDDAYRKKWEAEHPLGFFEHRTQFAPDGSYGKWIREHNAVVKINDTLFLHGGIGPKYAQVPLRKINEAIQAELRDFGKLQGGVAMDPEGPLWYRGLAQGDEAALAEHLKTVLDSFGVKRIVIGHTVTGGAVLPRFGGQVIMIDVGMSRHYTGNPACLVLEGGKAYALHRGTKLELPESGGLAEYLRKAAALDPAPSPVQKLLDALAPAAR